MRNLESIQRMEREDWDRNAAFYRDDESSPLMLHLAGRRNAMYALHPGERVLDLGCGSGATIASLQARDVRAMGVDFSPAMIAAAREQHELGELVTCADATKLPFDTHSFDVVIADGVLHHLTVQGKLVSSLREMHRVLKPGGRLCIFDRSGTLISTALLKLAIGVKTLLGAATGRAPYPSSATRNEIPFGGARDRNLIGRSGFKALRGRPAASGPFFMAVVVLNALQYFISRSLRRRIEGWLAPVIGWIDDRCAWPWLCVERVSVWEAIPHQLPQRSVSAKHMGSSSPIRLAAPPFASVGAPLSGPPQSLALNALRSGTPQLSSMSVPMSGVSEGFDESSPAHQCGVAAFTPALSPGGTAESDSHGSESPVPDFSSLRGSRS